MFPEGGHEESVRLKVVEFSAQSQPVRCEFNTILAISQILGHDPEIE
jgi:hypothetical protein